MVKRIDWTQIINEILKSDINIDFQFIARKIGVHRSSITRLRNNGIEPKYCHGEAIIQLWRNSTQKPAANPPYLKHKGNYNG